MSKVALVIPVGIGVVVAVFLSVYFGHSHILSPSVADSKPQDAQQKIDFTLAQIEKRASPYVGDKSAPITIVEFGDYQCTFCYKFHTNSLDIIKKDYIDSGKASLIFVDFPLNGDDSVLAAEAAHCANEQDKFWPMHDEIYKNWKGERTGWVNRDSLTEFAKTAGLDSDKMNSCIDSKKYHQTVLDTYQFGQGLQISGTPSFLIISGDKITKIVGNQPLDVFRKVLES
ncbi:MAG: DsbA family protein [Nitrososphaeria archaeon]|nr:DsbA family protein [Nitrososphaeria archaeon]